MEEGIAVHQWKWGKETLIVSKFTQGKAILITVVGIAMSFFHIYTAQFGVYSAMVQRPIHLAFAFVLIFLLHPSRKEGGKWWVQLLDGLFIAISVITLLHLVVTFKDVVLRGGSATTLDFWLGGILILLVLEVTRRVLGWALPIIASVSILYALLGKYIPGLWGHRGVDFETLISYQYLTTEGIFGLPLGVSATFIYIFILFGGFLVASGTGEFFIDFANSIAGHLKGGPAKVAVLSSACFGTISGSAVANVVGTGSFTIPLMKRLGYSPTFAGAVEAVASTGGQIMPPIMGAGAFIIAEMLGIPYIEVAFAAAIPAVLYYFALIYMVHLEAIRLGLRGLSKEELPRLGWTLKRKGYLLIPAFLLIYWLTIGYSPMKAGLWSIGTVFLFSFVRRVTWMGPMKLIEALKRGGTGCLEVVTACACAGVVIGVVTQTGLGLKFSTIVIETSKGYLPLALTFIAITSLILGMGVTTSAAYILTVILGGPVLVKLGVLPLAAHLFVFYYACLSTITPPIALAAYAGAGIAGAPPFTVGFMAMRLALVAYIVPYFFVFQPILILQGSFLNILFAFFTAILGCIALGSALMGQMLGSLGYLSRILLLAGGLTLIKPGIYTDMFGMAVFGIILGIQFFKGRKRG
jgi:TRAP transporter 4TM/12TM fusion protein